jgi:hypothetical protein
MQICNHAALTKNKTRGKKTQHNYGSKKSHKTMSYERRLIPVREYIDTVYYGTLHILKDLI